jgi:predicted metal-binding protein
MMAAKGRREADAVHENVLDFGLARPSQTKILVCGTCPRYLAKARDEKTLGVALADEIMALLGSEAAGNVRIVNCLAGCKNSCNVALTAPGKTRLRFSRLGLGDGQSIIKTAIMYAQCADADMSVEQFPEALRDRLSARSPAGIHQRRKV